MDNIRELMKYDPETGVCIWKKRKGDSPDVKCFNARFAGKEMGSINPGPKGQLYKRTRIKGRNYYIHRLIRTVGYYETPEEANVAYLKAAKEIHGEFANAG